MIVKKICLRKAFVLLCLAFFAYGMVSCDNVDILIPQNRAEVTTLEVVDVNVNRSGLKNDKGALYDLVDFTVKTDPHAKVFYRYNRPINGSKIGKEEEEEEEEQYNGWKEIDPLHVYSQTADENGNLTLQMQMFYSKWNKHSKWIYRELNVEIWALADGKTMSQNLIYEFEREEILNEEENQIPE